MNTRQMHRIVGLAGVLLAASTSQSQVTESWFRNFNYQNGPDVAVDVATDVYGSVYITGYADSGSLNQGLDMVTVKYDRDGNRIWDRPYNGPASGDDKAVRIHVDALGNVIVLGTSAGNGTNRDFVVIKYEPVFGNIIWPTSGSFGGYQFHNGAIRTTDTRDEDASDLFVDAAGNVYVIGSVLNVTQEGTDWDWKVIVFDQDQDNPGAVTLRAGWPVYVEGPLGLHDHGIAIAVDSAGQVVGTGTVGLNDVNDTTADRWATYSWSAHGVLNTGWPKHFPYTEDDKVARPYDLVIDHANNIYVCGAVGISIDMAVQKYSPTGGEPWGADGRVYDHSGYEDVAHAIALEYNNAKEATHVIVTGKVGTQRFQHDYGTWRLTVGGLGQPIMTCEGTGRDDVAWSLAVRGRGNIYVTGQSEGSNYDYATVMYASDGQTVWAARLARSTPA